MTKPSKTILVTGAANGIGRAVSLALGEEQAQLILLDRDEPNLDSLAETFLKRDYLSPVTITQDLAELTENGVTTLASQIESAFGSLDGVLHNGAEMGALAPIENCDLKAWSRTFRVNLYAPLLLTRGLLPLLKKSKKARIVFTTSDLGANPRAYWGAFSGSNAAIENFAGTLKEELECEDSIEIYTHNPGTVDTNWQRQAFPGRVTTDLPSPESASKGYLPFFR